MPIGPDDTVGSIYFDHLFPLGVEAMLEAVDQVRAGTAPKVAQDPNAGSYESWCRAEDARIDWNKPTQEIYNLIRGANPQPGAWTMLGEERLQLFDCHPSDAEGDPGAIVATGEASFTVAHGRWRHRSAARAACGSRQGASGRVSVLKWLGGRPAAWAVNPCPSSVARTTPHREKPRTAFLDSPSRGE